MPPIPAPFPAVLPPPAMAPPAAPTPAPTAPPIAASLTTSTVLSVALAVAWALHASTSAGDGAVATRRGGAAVGFAAGGRETAAGAVTAACFSGSFFQLATTRPAINAVTITSPSPIVVSFHGLYPSCVMGQRLLPGWLAPRGPVGRKRGATGRPHRRLAPRKRQSFTRLRSYSGRLGRRELRRPRARSRRTYTRVRLLPTMSALDGLNNSPAANEVPRKTYATGAHPVSEPSEDDPRDFNSAFRRVALALNPVGGCFRTPHAGRHVSP